MATKGKDFDTMRKEVLIFFPDSEVTSQITRARESVVKKAPKTSVETKPDPTMPAIMESQKVLIKELKGELTALRSTFSQAVTASILVKYSELAVFPVARRAISQKGARTRGINHQLLSLTRSQGAVR